MYKSRLEILRFSVVVLFTLMSNACSLIRDSTYPQNFHYLEKTDIQSSMHILANSVVNIEALLKHTQPERAEASDMRDTESPKIPEEEVLVEHILEELDTMIAVTESLLPATDSRVEFRQQLGRTNHLLIDEYVSDFSEDLLQAQLRLQTNPPDYLGLGRVMGNCGGCHQLR